MKLAVEFPAATVTEDGTDATALLSLESATAAPPEGAEPLRVTVPVDAEPPATPVGLSETREGAIGITV